MNKITYTKHCEFCGTELTTPLSDDIRWVPEDHEAVIQGNKNQSRRH